jgi:hypothetical protein
MWEAGEIVEEPHFSWSHCDTCGSALGGDRHDGHGILESGESKGEMVHLSMCVDCLLYFANGDLPDQWESYPHQARDLDEEEREGDNGNDTQRA